MQNKLWWARLVAVASLFVGFETIDIPSAYAQTYSGRAFAAFINTASTGPVYFADTGELPPAGGNRSANLARASVPGVFSANTLNASTSGGSGRAVSTASLENADVLPGHSAHLTASFLFAESAANGCNGSLTAVSVLSRVTFGGKAIVVTGQPNQTVVIPGVATLIINEQTRIVNGSHREARTNAIHLMVPGVAEVILSGTKADINCGSPAQ